VTAGELAKFLHDEYERTAITAPGSRIEWDSLSDGMRERLTHIAGLALEAITAEHNVISEMTLAVRKVEQDTIRFDFSRLLKWFAVPVPDAARLAVQILQLCGARIEPAAPPAVQQ
jgi:hypothetical protein